jgi:hypothetical protein
MSSPSISGLKPVPLAAMVPGGSARRHSRRCRLLRSPDSSSTFLRSLRSMAITPLHRYYGRSDSCSPRRITVCLTAVRSVNEQVSLIHALGLPTIPSPSTGNNNKRSASPSRGTLPHQRVRPRLHLQRVLLPTRSRGFTFATQARHTAGRIEFSFLSYGRDFLRTSRSPPAALHLVSRRRSCSRLRVTLTWRGLSPLRPNALSGAGSPGRQPWVEAPSLSPYPSPARAGEGCRRRGEGHPSQGLRPGLRYFAPGLRSLQVRAARFSQRTSDSGH